MLFARLLPPLCSSLVFVLSSAAHRNPETLIFLLSPAALRNTETIVFLLSPAALRNPETLEDKETTGHASLLDNMIELPGISTRSRFQFLSPNPSLSVRVFYRRAIDVLNEEKDKKAFNILKRKLDVENSHGQSIALTHKDAKFLEGSSMGVFMVNLTKVTNLQIELSYLQAHFVTLELSLPLSSLSSLASTIDISLSSFNDLSTLHQ